MWLKSKFIMFQVYCRYCYALKFGHRQKSDYKGWMDVKAIPGEVHDKLTCPRCGGKVGEYCKETDWTYLL